MSGPKPIEEVQAAKAKLARDCAGHAWFRGVGIAPTSRKDLFKLRLTVDPAAKNEAELPTECEGVPVEVVFVSAYKPRVPAKTRAGEG
jgi:hypothetical protein